MSALLSSALSFVLLFTYFTELLFSLSIIVITLNKSSYIGYYQLSDFIFLFIAHANFNTWPEAVARMVVVLV